MPDALEIRSELRGAYAPRHHARTAPSTGIFDTPAAIPAINADWIPHIIGALSLLEADDAWLGDDEARYIAIQEIEKLIEWLMSLRKVSAMPVGMIVEWFGELADAPAEWLYCDSTEYSSDDYPALFAVIPSAYHTDETHFVVPDLRGRGLICAGDAFFGETEVSAALADVIGDPLSELREHGHYVPTLPLGVQTGATTIHALQLTLEGSDAVNTDVVGTLFPTGNYHPVMAVHMMIVAR